MLIQNCLTPLKDLQTVSLNSTVSTTLKRMKEHNLETIPVLDEDGHFKGITGYSHIFQVLYNKKMPRDFFSQSVSETFQEIPTLTLDSNFEETLPIVVRYPFVPIVNHDDTFLGIVKISTIESALSCTFGHEVEGVRFLIGVFIDKPYVLQHILDSLRPYHVNIVSIVSFDAGDAAARRIMLKITATPYVKEIVHSLTERGFRILSIQPKATE